MAKKTPDPLRRFPCLRVGLVFASLALLVSSASFAQPTTTSPEAGDWPLEEVHTTDDHVYRGLIRDEHEGELEFVEVVRPRGRAMYLVVRPIAVKSIASMKRLPREDHQKLFDRVWAFRFRSRIEAGRMENVDLAALDDGGRRFLRFRGPWFTLDSTADEETTRRCVVRTEQIFRAYRLLLPPRVEPARPLRVILLESMDEYAAFLREHDLGEVTNPAIFSEKGNVIVAASELSRYAQRLETTREQHQRIREQYETLDKALPGQLAELRKQLAGQGVSKDAIDDELNAREALWRKEQAQALQQLNAADRRNEAAFAEVTEAMFRRLYHEGLHAYLENYVYPHEQYNVPIWLNEGLAQVFQSGQLEADTLRIDAPLPEALAAVQADLKSDEPLLIEELVAAGRSDFLGGSGRQEQANRLYAYAWAVAYYLAYYQPVLGSDTLDAYVSKEAAQLPPPQRLEKLLGTPIGQFESRWLKTIQALK